nr:phosphoribosylanthranilate isomerase [Allomuricauda sp.]
MKLKVCGMKFNPGEVARLSPDYLGFIFWEPSARFFDGNMPELPKEIKKVGVFVDAPLNEVIDKINTYALDAVQLHGKESPEYCEALRSSQFVLESHDGHPKQVQVDVIKVFSIKDSFDFTVLGPYENVCDYFLFDTKGKLPGGNGYGFDWTLLKEYPSTKPYFLSGGIGLESASKLQAFLDSPASRHCKVIDVNSRFEIEPGLKDVDQLNEFKKFLTQDTI